MSDDTGRNSGTSRSRAFESLTMVDGVPVSTTITAYTVCAASLDNPEHWYWAVTVENAGHGRWAVRRGPYALSVDREWDHEPQPSSRTDTWLEKHRWKDLDEALASARQAAPDVTINGIRAADLAPDQPVEAHDG